MENEKQEQLVTIDGVQYNFDEMTDEQKNLIILWNRCNEEVVQARAEVYKLEAAIRDISRTVQDSLRKPPKL